MTKDLGVGYTQVGVPAFKHMDKMGTWDRGSLSVITACYQHRNETTAAGTEASDQQSLLRNAILGSCVKSWIHSVVTWGVVVLMA